PAVGTLRALAAARADAPSARSLGESGEIRVSTGAAIPQGADAVVRQEAVDVRGEEISVAVPVAPGQNIRAAGEDLQAGAAVLQAGAVLGPAELGLAVAAGMGELPVARRPTVAILSTGDELRAPGEALGPGQIHN